MELGIRKAENKKLRAERKEKVKDRGLEAGKEDKRIRRCGPATVRGWRLEAGPPADGGALQSSLFELRPDKSLEVGGKSDG